jgi:Uma2 family endonuclease
MKTVALLNAEDFARVAPVLGPCELVKGEIVRMSPGGIRHSRVTGNAFSLLDSHCRQHDLGRVLTGEAGVVVARQPDTVRGADIAFISYRRLAKGRVGDGFLHQPPEFVIEVLAKDTSWDRIEEKIGEYHAFGVDLVWVLDPQTLTLRSYPSSGPPALFRDADDVSADPAVQGFSVRVSRFFED